MGKASIAGNRTRQQDPGSVGVPALTGRRVVILGLARQGLALARFATAAGATVTLSDKANEEALGSDVETARALGATLVLGGHPLSLLDDCDLLFLSGGVPPQTAIAQEAIRRGIPLSNDSLLTLQLAHARGLGPILAITGSSGKTTTTTLVGRMLEASGQTPHVGGNIGSPLIDRQETILPGEPIVLELSSFQLELFDASLAAGRIRSTGPHVAAILNVTPNHLDRHPSMAAYAGAKFNLLRCLPQNAVVVLNADDPVTAALMPEQVGAGATVSGAPSGWQLDTPIERLRAETAELNCRWQPFSRLRVLDHGAWLDGNKLVWNGQPFARRDEVRLRGDHNISNLLAAAAIAGAAGATVEGMHAVAASFGGVRHRLEIVSEVGGVTWVNDSIATSPERALAGLRSFDPEHSTIILLAGGRDKHLPWDQFAEEVLARVSFLIGFGESGSMIVDKVRAQAQYARTPAPSMAVVQRLDEAVELAARSAGPGAIVLLSPGGTSYDAYHDFEARGEHFRALVERFAALGAGGEGQARNTP